MQVNDVLALAWERYEAGQYEAAEHLARQIVGFQAKHVDANHLLGLVNYRQGRVREAIKYAEKAARLAPKNASFHSNLSQMYRLVGKLDKAREYGKRAVDLNPKFADALNNLGIVHYDLQDFAGAEEHYRQAIAVRPDFPEALNNLGNVLRLTQRYDEAASSYQQAIALRPTYSEALANLGIAERDQGHFEAATALFRRALEANPKNANAHTCLAMIQLLQGNWRQGLAGYEWRVVLPGFKRPRHRAQTWRGEAIAGKRLLIFAEQGLGDTLQFARFLPALAAQGPQEVVFLVSPALRELLAAALPGVTVVDRVSPLDAFDCSLPLLSLPLRLGVKDSGAIRGVPYLAAAPEHAAAWRELLAPLPSPRVAVAWAGNPQHANDRNRSIPFASFRRLLESPGIGFVAAQPGAFAELAGLPPGTVVDAGERLSSFAATAGLLAGVDLVISVDTALAHLAGALGKEVWILLPPVPDWRWGLHGGATPWYATARLFRAEPGKGWEPTIGQVSGALAELRRRS